MRKKNIVKKNQIKESLGVIVGIYIILSIVALIDGILGADFHYTGCAEHNRLEYLTPTYRLGCWLGEPLNKDETK